MATTNNCDPQNSSDSTCDFIIPLRNVLIIPETSQQFDYCLYSLTKNQSTTHDNSSTGGNQTKGMRRQPQLNPLRKQWKLPGE